jgi:hypothetical protein
VFETVDLLVEILHPDLVPPRFEGRWYRRF